MIENKENPLEVEVTSQNEEVKVEDKGFSISNLKQSLFSKISSIFQQPALVSQIDTKTVNQETPVKPKFPCSCGLNTINPNFPYLCKEAYLWYSRYNKGKDYKVLKKIYRQLIDQEVEKETENQINRDLCRTFPKHDYFKEGSKGMRKLQRVLSAFSNYDH